MEHIAPTQCAQIDICSHMLTGIRPDSWRTYLSTLTCRYILGLCWSWLHFEDITFIGHIASLSNFFLIFEHIFEHIKGPLSGLFWRTEKCRSNEIRGDTFSIRPFNCLFICIVVKFKVERNVKNLGNKKLDIIEKLGMHFRCFKMCLETQWEG